MIIKRAIFFLTRLFFKIFFKAEVRGIENIPSNEPLIIASNHISNYDPPAILSFASLKRDEIYVVAKEELFKNKIFGYFLKQMGAIPIDRKNPQISSIKKSIEILRNKKTLLIFPEGTRRKEKDINPKDGISFIAYKTGAKIIPVKISIVKNNSKLGKIIIVFDKPISFERHSFYGRQTLKEISKKIIEKIYSINVES